MSPTGVRNLRRGTAGPRSRRGPRIEAWLGTVTWPWDRPWARSPWPATAVALLACGLQVGVAALGDSAAVVGLGPATALPPWDLDRSPSSALVTALLASAAVLGVLAVGLGLRAVRAGAVFSPRVVAAAGTAVVALMVLVPPLGSADHLSYAAYGRIAAAGDDPYTVAPGAWRDGRDPVAGAVQPPWREEPSVYGPVATAVQAGAALVGGGSLRRTVWAWQLLAGLCFLLVAWLLDRLVRAPRGAPDLPGDAAVGPAADAVPAGAARSRAAVLWTLNPLLVGQLVLGAHLDLLAVAAVTGALALALARPVLAGVLLGIAVGVKAPYALVGLALCWGLRWLPRRRALAVAGRGALGALLVLVPAHCWSGQDTYDYAARASRYVSLATPWRLAVDQLDPLLGATPVRRLVGPLALVLAALVCLPLARGLDRALGRIPLPDVGTNDPAPPDPAPNPDAVALAGGAREGAVRVAAVRAWAVLGIAWVLTAPYVLPWYDAVFWVPLALLAGATAGSAGADRLRGLETALLFRLGVLVLAYVPGRVVGMSAGVERLTLTFRREVAPWLVLLGVLAVLAWATGRLPRGVGQGSGTDRDQQR